jgi:hypothetical protein
MRMPAAPGKPGRRIEYFLKKPRHRFMVSMGSLTCLCLLYTGVTQWQSGSRQMAAVSVAMGVSLVVMNVWSWRRGVRKAQEMRALLE